MENNEMVCSHQWRDAAYINQLVHNEDVSPAEMKAGHIYQCVRCEAVLTNGGQDADK